MMDSVVVSLQSLQQFCADALRAAGVPSADADTAAHVLCRTDAFGIHSHGTKNLDDYIRKMEAGGMCRAGTPRILREGPSWAAVDAQNVLGMVAGTMGMETAIRKCQQTGIGIVNVIHSEHFGAAGYYAVLAAEQGLIGLSMSNVDANMTIPGAKGKVMGNNPFAYALPAGTYPPIFLDIALSAVASLKVVQARRDGVQIPTGWIVDKNGLPTTDPSHYPEEGAMMPMAAHKGYGLAVLVEALTSILGGGPMMMQVPSWLFCMPEPNDVSHTFLCMDPACFTGADAFRARVDEAIAYLHGLPRADGCERIYYPGEMEWERHSRAVQCGLALPADTLQSLRRLSKHMGIAVPWEE